MRRNPVVSSNTSRNGYYVKSEDACTWPDADDSDGDIEGAMLDDAPDVECILPDDPAPADARMAGGGGGVPDAGAGANTSGEAHPPSPSNLKNTSIPTASRKLSSEFFAKNFF